MLDDDSPKTAAQRERLLDALTQLADTDPLLRCEVDSITHEIILSFWAGCSWRLFPLCCRKNTRNSGKGTLRHLYGAAQSGNNHTIHIGAQPVLGIHRTVCYTTLAWLRCTIREPGFAGILEPEFFKTLSGMVSVTGWSRACSAGT